MAKVSTKRVQIDKSMASMVVIVSVASFILVFSLIACKALLSQRAYQSRVIAGKEKAKEQLQQNIESVEKLRTQYRAFVETSENVLGGNPAGKGDKDGDNARIVLDALPSKYDFPALATSLEKLVAGYKTDGITGTDDEISQSNQKGSANPTPLEIPFQLGVTTNYQSAIGFLAMLEKSIRPINIKTLSVNATSGQINLSVSANTYYQPSKTLNVTTKEIR